MTGESRVDDSKEQESRVLVEAYLPRKVQVAIVTLQVINGFETASISFSYSGGL